MVERSSTLDRTFGALANPIRRTLLEILQTGETRVTDLAMQFDVSLAAVSKHVRVLESADLIGRTVDGRDHLLALKPESLTDAGEWIETQRRFWEARIAALDTYLRQGR